MKRAFDDDCSCSLRDAIRKELEPLSKRIGVGFVIGKPTTRAGRFVCELTACPLNPAQLSEQTSWNLRCRMFGFEESDWGKVFICQSKKFKLWNINPDHAKPIVTRCRKIKNQFFHFTPEYVKQALAQSLKCEKCKTQWRKSQITSPGVCADANDASRLFYKQSDETWLCGKCDLVVRL